MKREEELPPFNFPIEDKSERIIKVIGVGGGGGNAVQHMWEKGVTNVSFVVINTDAQALVPNQVPNKIQLGDGLGAGGDPVIGRKKAEESMESVKAMLEGDTKMVFITAGLGGGTGTGAAPLIARAAKDMGILTVGVVTLPFRMEGKKRINCALRGLEEMRKSVDSLIVINNEKLLEDERFVQMDWEEGMKKADEVLTIATKTIAEIITVRGKVNRDFNDVNTVMKNGGAAVVSIALKEIVYRYTVHYGRKLNSPAVEANAWHHQLREINEFMEDFDENIDVLWGHYQDDTLEDEIKVAIVATGFDQMEYLNGKGDDESDEKRRLQLLCEKYYADHHEEPAVKEEPEVVPVVDEPTEDMAEENLQESDEGEDVEDEQPMKSSFWDVFVRKLKVLVEEE